MPAGQTTLQDIPLELLEGHPENSNFMDADTFKKLRRHIEQTGRYEPLTVRPHPSKEGTFQVINGHNRLRALRALGYQTARCIVWNLSDGEARLYLTTLNRLSGTDISERRAALLESLLTSFTIDELSSLLPDNRKQLEELAQLSRLDLDEVSGRTIEEEDFPIPVILSFMLDESEAKEVNRALDLILKAVPATSSRSRALVRLARFYLDGHKTFANE